MEFSLVDLFKYFYKLSLSGLKIMKVNNTMIKKRYLEIFLILNLVKNASSQVFQPGTLPPDCLGSLHLYSDDGKHTFTESAESLGMGIVTQKVKMEGCGCYILYQGTGRTGKAYFITENGEQNIDLSRIRSVYRQNCAVEEVINAGIILVVAAVVLLVVGLVGAVLICRVKRRKKFNEDVTMIEV